MEGFLKSTNTFKTLDEMFCSSNSSSSGVNGDERFSSVGLLYTTADKNKKSDSCLGKSTKKKRNDEDKDIKNIVENNKRGKVTNKTSLLSFDFDQQTEIKGENKIVEQMMGKNDNETKEKSESFNIIENNIQVSEENYTSLSFNSIGKDKTIDTSFLPDRKKEIEEQIMIEKLKKEEIEKEEKLKSQIIEVVFSYWEGRGHRRSIKIQRDATIGEFLEKCRIKLKSEFKEFARISSGSLMYIKEDVILPHSITFHELIKTKARGKTGPLFHFNVFDDIRTVTDVRKETTESHAGKVVRRQWYEKNKHVYPAYRWESYVPGKFKEPYSMKG